MKIFKSLFCFFFLSIVGEISSLYARELTLEYIANPQKAFLYKNDRVYQKELLTLKTNIMYFSNDQGLFHLNFFFKRDKDLVQKTEISIKVGTFNNISPFDGFNQRIKMTIVGMNNNSRVIEEFAFNKREVLLTVQTNNMIHLDMIKYLSPTNEVALQNIFSSNKQILFQIEGSMGIYDFIFPRPLVLFYKTFFDYKNNIYKNKR